MRKGAVIALVLILVAAIILALALLGQTRKQKDIITDQEKQLARLNSELEQTNENVHTLQQRALTSSEEVQTAKQRNSDLQNMLQAKSQQLQSLQRKISELAKAEKDLNKQQISQQETIKSLQKQLDDSHSKLVSCQQNIVKEQAAVAQLQKQASEAEKDQAQHANSENQKIDQLQRRIAALGEGKESAESKLEGLATTNAALVSQLKKHIQKQEVTIKQYQQKLSVTFLDRVLFGSGKVSITAEGKSVLTKVGKVLKGVTGETIQVIGNTDAVPIAPEYRHRFASNWELSADRAAAVVRFLQEKCGVDPKNMEAVGRSSYYPIASNASPEGRAKNRNVEMVISPKLEAG